MTRAQEGKIGMRVMIAGADASLRASIGFSLSHEGYEVFDAEDYDNAFALFKREAIELALLDMDLAVPGALHLCRTLRRASRLPIMILAGRDSEDDLVEAFEAGADDYVRKPFSPRALVARVRALARRAQPERGQSLQAGDLELDLEEHMLRIGSTAAVRLTPMELKALHVLFGHRGRTVSSEKLLTLLWGNESERERHTLKQLIYRLRGKLHTVGAAELLQTTQGSGYKLAID